MPAGIEQAVRQPLSVPEVPRRRFEERLGIRFPRGLAAFIRGWLSLPRHSRLRRELLRHTVVLGVAAANRRDYRAAFAVYHPDVELIMPSGLVALGFEPVVRGHPERVRFEQRWRTEWGDFRYAPDDVYDLGDRVLVVGYMRGSGPSSGAGFDNEWAVLFDIRAGQVVGEQVFLDHGEALEAAGLS
jgi:ketosteroid isomerase-like protein